MTTKYEKRLAYLRSQIRLECISLNEIAELQALAPVIPFDDVELLEWASAVRCNNCESVYANTDGLEQCGKCGTSAYLMDMGTYEPVCAHEHTTAEELSEVDEFLEASTGIPQPIRKRKVVICDDCHEDVTNYAITNEMKEMQQ